MICQFVAIIVVLMQKILNFAFAYLLLFDIKIGLYPYSDIQDSLSSYVVSSNALFGKIFLTLIGIILSIFSILLCIWVLRNKRLRYFAIVLLILSSVEITFFSLRFVELNKLVSLVENCDFDHQVEVGCSIPPDKF
ncbi:hypothetical protein Pse7367_3467 [Thalassoporum mexicanum PCC 7367]|nr:hypothetical protein Pse7367_3467 [Pseudanabaena sp. PCC 7367]